MANLKTLGEQISNKQLEPTDRLKDLINRIDYKKRFEEILGKKTPAFISSLLTLVNQKKELKVSDPKSVLSAAMVAATLDLPINSNLGFAHIVPYSGVAQFQMGWKGFVQLAIRTRLYQTMNASEVYEDELESWNPITGELKLKPQDHWKQRYSGNGKVIGYAAFFKLMNGFEKYLYMTVEQCLAHGRKYSKSFGTGLWKTDPHPMSLKTVMKLLLSKYGILSVEMQEALRYDQGVIKETPEGEKVEYPDGVDSAIDTTASEIDKPNDAIES